jgi:hypothetical protein
LVKSEQSNVGGWATRSTRQRSRRVPLSTRSDSRSPGIFLSPPENSPQHQSVFAVHSYNQDKSLQHFSAAKETTHILTGQLSTNNHYHRTLSSPFHHWSTTNDQSWQHHLA